MDFEVNKCADTPYTNLVTLFTCCFRVLMFSDRTGFITGMRNLADL